MQLLPYNSCLELHIWTITLITTPYMFHIDHVKLFEVVQECYFDAEFADYEVKPTIFTYNELRIATEDFKPHMKLGKGAYGTVYKVRHGTLS